MSAKRKFVEPVRWDLLMRFRLIEIIALWEGRVTTTHLINNFGIARQQASKDINNYLNTVAPDNLIYDTKLRGYKPSKTFTPQLTSGIAEEYLQALAGHKEYGHTFQSLDLGFNSIELLRPPMRQISPKILRALIQAAKNNQKIDLGYVSLFSPDEESRIIAPHSLVCTPLRWHVRAYCEKNRDFRDFVLSRFRTINGVEGKASVAKEQDAIWNKAVAIEIVPDPRLSPYQKDIIEQDYNMEKGLAVIETRAALLPYALQALNIDIDQVQTKPEAQQIVIRNLEEVRGYGF